MFTFDAEKNSLIKKLSTSDNTILITGETGSGKSYLAEKIHLQSHRKDKKFIAINLATLNENLIESELFGHEKGAFSGAILKRIGKFEIANGGTVLLDEIGELSLSMQTRLLEALNSKTISPVGSNKEIKLDIRFIAATNRCLSDMIKTKQFRNDLYYRINTFQILLPSIKENKEYTVKLANDFLKNIHAEYIFSDSCLQAICEYEWPGNIRELKNAVQYAVTVSSSKIIEIPSLPPYIFSQQSFNTVCDPIFPINYYEAKDNFEKNYLNFILEKYEGKINLTSRESQLSKVTLIDKIRRHNINVSLLKINALQGSVINHQPKHFA